MNLDWIPFAAFVVIAIAATAAVWSLFTPFERVHLRRLWLAFGPWLLVGAALGGAILCLFQ